MAERSFSLDLDPETQKKIELLQTELSLKSEEEVVAYAVALLIDIVDERKKGNKVLIPSGQTFSRSTTTYRLP